MNIRLILSGLLACATLCSTPGIVSARTIRMGEIFETNTGTAGNGTIGQFNVSTGAAKPNLVQGLSGPTGSTASTDMAGVAASITPSGSLQDLFVANIGTGTIGEYDANTGMPIKKALISGLDHPMGIALENDDLFVVSRGGIISEYITSGAPVSLNLITGLKNPIGIAVEDGHLFVATNNGTVSEYTTSGVLLRPPVKTASRLEGIAVSPDGSVFVVDKKGAVDKYNPVAGTVTSLNISKGLKDPIGIAAIDFPLLQGGFETDLFVVNNTGGKKVGTGTITEYDAATGDLITTIENSGLVGPTGIFVTPVPEPSSWTLTLLALGPVAMCVAKPLLRRRA